MGDFTGTFGDDFKFGSFYFGAFSEQTLDTSKLAGKLLQMSSPGLLKVPAEPEAAPKKIKRAMVEKIGNVPSSLKRFK